MSVKSIEIDGQKVEVFASLGEASQASSRLIDLLARLGRLVPMGDGMEVFLEIKQGLVLVNNTLVIGAKAAQDEDRKQLNQSLATIDGLVKE